MKITIGDEAKSTPKQNLLSKISFGCAILTLVLIIIFSTFLPALGKIKANEASIESPPDILPVILHVCILIGAISAILSVVIKETKSWYKWVGFALNLTLLLLIYGTILFATLIDMSR